MDEKQYQELVAKIGADAANKIKADMEAAEKRINEKWADTAKGLFTKADFEKFKTDEMAKVNEQLGEISKLTEAVKEQGIKLKDLTDRPSYKQGKSMMEFMSELAPKLKGLYGKNGQFVEISAKELIDYGVTFKAADSQSVGGSVVAQSGVPANPYLPMVSPDMPIFEILRNANFMSGRVNLGRTDSPRLAWVNELSVVGAPAKTPEGGRKPQVERKFKVEMSQYVKSAAWSEITEEFDKDLPQLSTIVRRLLGEDVIRAWDDDIQQAVIDASTKFGITGLNGKVPSPDLWLTLYAMRAQVIAKNFVPNTLAVSPLTDVLVQGQKNSQGTYLLPPFLDVLRPLYTLANKIAPDYAFAGDLRQFNVDIYEDLMFKIGWINEQFIQNKFSILAEIKWHSYISDSRKAGLIYDKLQTVKDVIDAAAS